MRQGIFDSDAKEAGGRDKREFRIVSQKMRNIHSPAVFVPGKIRDPFYRVLVETWHGSSNTEVTASEP